jgi:hypothetical protein
MWAFVFFASYLVVRKLQPTNYRAYDLAGMTTWFALMAFLTWAKNGLKGGCNGRKHEPR